MNPLIFMNRGGKNTAGLSLIEVLISCGIIAVLASLILPAVNSIKTRALDSQCVSNLREIGHLAQANAQDNNGMLQYFISGNDDNQHGKWTYELSQIGGLTNDMDMYKAFTCPVQRPDPGTFKVHWNAYGMYMFGDPGTTNRVSGYNAYTLRLAAVERPMSRPLAGDSWEAPTRGQSFRILSSDLSVNNAGFHLRHNGRANVVFLDGHVASLDRKALADLGMKKAFDSATNAISLP